MDDFGFVEAVDRLDQRIVVGMTPTTSLGETGISDLGQARDGSDTPNVPVIAHALS